MLKNNKKVIIPKQLDIKNMKEEDLWKIIDILWSIPKIKVIEFFVNNYLFDFSKKEAMEAVEMDKQTFYRYFQELEKERIIKVSRKKGKTKFYKINLKHPFVQKLIKFERRVFRQIFKKKG
jgi:hypothetical protein